MTVLENVMVGRHSRMRSGFVAALLNLPGTWRETREAQAKAQAILDDLGLSVHAGEDRSEPVVRHASGWWNSPGPWRWNRRCCCSMSRRPD